MLPGQHDRFAGARTLRKFSAPELVDKVLPQVTSLDFDSLRQGAMFMTAQRGAGSDVSATEVVAEAPGRQLAS